MYYIRDIVCTKNTIGGIWSSKNYITHLLLSAKLLTVKSVLTIRFVALLFTNITWGIWPYCDHTFNTVNLVGTADSFSFFFYFYLKEKYCKGHIGHWCIGFGKELSYFLPQLWLRCNVTFIIVYNIYCKYITVHKHFIIFL